MNTAFLMENEPGQIIDDMKRLLDLPPGHAVAWGRYLTDRQVSEYSVGIHEEQFSGIFHRITGALTGQGLQIVIFGHGHMAILAGLAGFGIAVGAG